MVENKSLWKSSSSLMEPDDMAVSHLPTVVSVIVG